MPNLSALPMILARGLTIICEISSKSNSVLTSTTSPFQVAGSSPTMLASTVSLCFSGTQQASDNDNVSDLLSLLVQILSNSLFEDVCAKEEQYEENADWLNAIARRGHFFVHSSSKSKTNRMGQYKTVVNECEERILKAAVDREREKCRRRSTTLALKKVHLMKKSSKTPQVVTSMEFKTTDTFHLFHF